MTLNRNNALDGSLVADAASMGLHWLYDQDRIAQLENSGELLFRQPEANVYKDVKGFFAHAVKHTGELSHYGESTRIAGQLAIDSTPGHAADHTSDNTFDVSAFRQRFYDSFGPCGSYSGYADRPTKQLIARMIISGDDITEPSGMDDDQMPALCVVAGLFAAGYDESAAINAASALSSNTDTLDGARVVYRCLALLADGTNLNDALVQSANTLTTALGESLHEALKIDSYQPQETAVHFGLACYVRHALPVVWHLLKHAPDFETLVRDNIRCGGDCCGRAVAAGAIAGFAFGVPPHLINRMAEARIPINR